MAAADAAPRPWLDAGAAFGGAAPARHTAADPAPAARAHRRPVDDAAGDRRRARARARRGDRSRRRQLERGRSRAIDSGVERVETSTREWLAREAAALGIAALAGGAHGVARRDRYDLAINFEPDIRSNLLLAASGARVDGGFASGGGGPLLDIALDLRRRVRTRPTTRGGWSPRSSAGTAAHAAAARCRIPEARIGAADRAARRAVRRPLVGIHVSGGRAIKQWPRIVRRSGRRLVARRGARSC